MTQFTINTSYYMTSPCDQECKWTYKVIARTACTVTLKDEDNKVIKCRVRKDYDNCEAVKPLGSYSMAPVLRASRIA